MCVPSKKDKNAPTYYMSQEFKDYVLFKPNSQWIYKLESQDVYDTLEIIEQNISITNYTDIFDYKGESINQTISSTYLKNIILGGGGAGTLGSKDICGYSQGINAPFLVSQVNFFTGKTTGEYLSNLESSKTKYLLFFNTYIVLDKTFQNVKVFEKSFELSALLPRKVYYAKNVGLIRKELWNGQVWNLVDYEVKQ
jgi:hypothetical protein